MVSGSSLRPSDPWHLAQLAVVSSADGPKTSSP